jgi:branched-chain amino acid transport system substrate-binding protein
MNKRPLSIVILLAMALVPFAGVVNAQEGEPILIGLEGPMTGDYAYEGQGFVKAVELLVNQVNEAGGLLGRPVELVIEDDAGDPTQAALVADRLVDAGVVAVIGAYNSTATEPASEIYNEAGILHITPSSTATRLTQKGFDQFFRVCFLDDRQALFAVLAMKDVLGAETIGILHDNSTYAAGLADWTQIYAEEHGFEVAFFDAINPDDQDFTPILTNIGEADLDAVYFTGYHAQGGLLLRQTAELDLDILWMMGNASNNPEMVEIAGAEAAAGTFITTEPLPQDLEYPEAIEFVEAFEEAYGEPPASVWWLLAAEAFNVIAHAIEETGSTDTEVLAAYLHEDFADYPGLSGPIIGFDEKGDRLGTIHLLYQIDEEGDIVYYPEQPGAGEEEGEMMGIDAEALVAEVCSVCHGLDRVEANYGEDADYWTTTVARMIGNGAALEEGSAEFDAVVEWLASQE